MPKPKKGKPARGMLQADVSRGSDWLQQLTEPQFRDEVLKDLFGQMKKAGAIADHVYNHGSREHGIDWIVLDKGGLSDRFVGIQVKSQPLSRQGDSSSNSALAVKQQCLSAYDHTFTWKGNSIRIDVVELWMSAHITADAVAEFDAPVSQRRVAVKTAESIFSLLEMYCPKVISKIPGLAESGYVTKMADPQPMGIKLLGVHLNPKKHFIEPRFSRFPGLSPDRILNPQTKKMSQERPLHLEDILSSKVHAIIVGPELSGKSYILSRIACITAANDQLPALVDATIFSATAHPDACRILAEHLNWYSLASLQNPTSLSRSIILLVDNADCLTDGQIQSLLSTSHKKIVIMLASRKSRAISGFTTYYIAGVRNGAIQRFVRSLDVDQGTAVGLVERATQYVHRTLGVSGLPANPFTVSVLLDECSVAKKKLATPTMGRLIERFVLGQLGSHADATRVDYETKDRFLTHLGGKHAATFSCSEFRRRLARFIAVHGHAHATEDFEQDLVDSGLIEEVPESGQFRWSHPIFRDFFWVRNLVREKRYKILARILIAGDAQAIAAIAGSQMNNAHEVFVRLLQALPQKDWAGEVRRSRYLLSAENPGEVFPSDSDEEAMLTSIEDHADGMQEDAAPNDDGNTKEQKSFEGDDNVIKKLSLFAAKYVEEKHALIVNVSALLLNARGLPREDKVAGVLCVVRSNARMCKHFSEVIQSIKDKRVNQFLADLFSRFIGLTINDIMVGDAFLSEILKELLRKASTAEERLFIVDLLVASGSAPSHDYIELLKANNDLADTVAIYLRLVNSYYYRYHKPEEKTELKATLKEVRRLAKGLRLTAVK